MSNHVLKGGGGRCRDSSSTFCSSTPGAGRAGDRRAPAGFLVFVSLLPDLSCRVPVSFHADAAGGNLSAVAFLRPAPAMAPHLLQVLGHGGRGSPVGTTVIGGGSVQNHYVGMPGTLQKLAFSFGGVGMEMLSVEPRLGAEGLGCKWKKRLVESCYVG